jgi:Na+/pantothenate symporter
MIIFCPNQIYVIRSNSSKLLLSKLNEQCTGTVFLFTFTCSYTSTNSFVSGLGFVSTRSDFRNYEFIRDGDVT